MLKYALLAGVMTIAAPAMAQTAPTQDQAAPTQAAPAPMDATTAAPATDPAQAATPAAPTPADGATAQASPASPQTTGQPAPTGDQVASVVNTEFPSYDANKDGKLSQAEFGSWMVALKEKSDPATKADSAQTKQWVGAAFAQADTDKNKALTKEELTSFLSQGQS